jgi:hypothetical protein
MISLPSKLLAAALTVILAAPVVAQVADPAVKPDYRSRHALVKSAYRPMPNSAAKPLPPVGLLGKQQFRMFSATWAQFHRSVASGDVEILRTVVRNSRACKGALAYRAEMLMESRAKVALADTVGDGNMGDLIMAVGQKIQAEQLGESDAPFLVSAGQTSRVLFGNVMFVEGANGFWSVDLGC